MNAHDVHTPLLQLDRVTHRFGEQIVLQELSLTVHRGETLVVIGESGCGKSVTLKLLTALLAPTTGNVLWQGRPVWKMKPTERERERLRLGFLFQGAALFDSMTVFENIAFGLRQNRSLPELEIRAIVQARLRDVGLRDSVGDRKPADLSGGMKKRVALARALALEPEIMVYDEPTTGLDPVMSDVINQLILRTHDRLGVTSVVVTHDMRTVERVADRVIMLRPLSRMSPQASQTAFEGTARELLQSNDSEVRSFVRGEAAERIEELSLA